MGVAPGMMVLGVEEVVAEGPDTKSIAGTSSSYQAFLLVVGLFDQQHIFSVGDEHQRRAESAFHTPAIWQVGRA